MVDFNFWQLFLVLLSFLISGALIGISLLKRENLLMVEKILLGTAAVAVLTPALPFLLFLVGIKFSYPLALLSLLLPFLLGVYLWIREKPSLSFSLKDVLNDRVSPILILLLLVSFLIRFSSLSPVFMELDPYYYTYVATQIITLGGNPLNDQTAWYPVLEVDHRQVPLLAYLEAIWYVLYKGSTEYNNLLLASIAATYPPLAAMLTVFFIYLFTASLSDRKAGLLAGGLLAFMPSLIQKMFAGVMEVQPYAFFSLSFMLASLALYFTRKNKLFLYSTMLGIFAVSLGSNSTIFASVALTLFFILDGLFAYLKDREEELSFLFNASLYLLAAFLLSGAIYSLFSPNNFGRLLFSIPFASAPLFLFILLNYKKALERFSLPKDVLIYVSGFLCALLLAGAFLGINLAFSLFWLSLAFLALSYYYRNVQILAALFSLFLVALAFTPLGEKLPGYIGLRVAQFTTPLARTIAEQGVASPDFGPSLGFIADDYASISSFFLRFLGKDVVNLAASLLALLGVPFSLIGNLILQAIISFLNFLFNSSLSYVEKENSLFLFWFSLFIALTAYRIWKKEHAREHFLTFALILPAVVVGALKAKYTIYTGFLFAPLVALTLYDLPLKKKEYLYALLLFLQFFYNFTAPGFLVAAFKPVYYNQPSLFYEKFAKLCDETGIAKLCDVANNPEKWSSGFRLFDPELCAASLISDFSRRDVLEGYAVFAKCSLIAPYWLESMEWIRENTEEGARILSWWDYGHWINYFGERNAVIRNEHRYPPLQYETANMFLHASPEQLKNFMERVGAKYVLFDTELILGGNNFGGKYGALNYLSCVWMNRTNVSFAPGQSKCESEYLWETIIITEERCTISNITGKNGRMAYYTYIDDRYTPFYPQQCANFRPGCERVRLVPAYCVGDAVLADGSKITTTYLLNQTNELGELKLNRAILAFATQIATAKGPATQATLLYTKDKIWLGEGGEVVDGYQDARWPFYRSNLYKGLFIDELEGFRQVFASEDGNVKIYMRE